MRPVRWAVGLALAGMGAVPVACLAQDRAPAEACAGKLAQVQSGNSQDVAADVDWLSKYCNQATKDAALNAVGEAAMDGAINDVRAASQAAANQAKSNLAAVRAASNAATGQAMVGAMQDGAAAIAAGPVVAPVIVVAPAPRVIVVRPH